MKKVKKLKLFVFFFLTVFSISCEIQDQALSDFEQKNSFNQDQTFTTGACPAKSVAAEDFGAVGDGKNDDTAALQAAINTGKPVCLGRGRTYRITRTLVLKSGSTLTSSGTGDLRSVIMMDDDFFNNDHWGYFIDSYPFVKTNAVGISIHNESNVEISNLQIRLKKSDGRFVIGISVRGSKHITISKNLLTGFSWASGIITLDTVHDVDVTHNQIIDCFTNRLYGSPGQPQLTGITVDDNRIIDNDDNSTGYSSQININNNEIKRLKVGPVFLERYGYQTDAINIAGIRTNNVNINYNEIIHVGEGIDIFGYNNTVWGNYIYEPYFVGIKLIHGASGNWVEENQVYRPGTYGILVSGSVVGPVAFNEIRNNHIGGAGKNPTLDPLHGSTAAIALKDGEVNHNKVRNNEIWDAEGMDFAILTNTGYNNFVEGNCASGWRREFHRVDNNASNRSFSKCPWTRLP